jgi:hypothetical protein
MNPNGNPSDLASILARLGPEQRAALLQWRERIRRFQENDEILALTGYLDTCVRLVDIMTRDIEAGVKACPAHVRQAAAEQAELMRKGLLAQIEHARKEEQAAREKHLSEIRQEQSTLAEERARGWDAKVANHLTTALLSVFFTALAVLMIDTKRIDEAAARADARVAEERAAGESRFNALVDKLPYAARLETQLEAIGARLDYRHVEASGKTRGHYELALKPGPGFKPSGAGVDRTTGEAVITFPE